MRQRTKVGEIVGMFMFALLVLLIGFWLDHL